MHPAETGLLIPSGKRGDRPSEVLLHISGNATYQELGGCRCSMGRGKVITTLANPSDLSLTRKAEQASQ